MIPMTMSVYLCVIRDEMIIYKAFLGQAAASDSIRTLQGRGELEPLDSWSEVSLNYEKYEAKDLQRVWDMIAKSPEGLQNFAKVPEEGTWGLLYEN
jgi:hypothetical protein